MKKLLLLSAALVAFSGAFAKKVLFRVDMTGQAAPAPGVFIAGDFQKAAGFAGDWDPTTTSLTREGTTSWYSVLVTIPAKKKYEFKFLNGNTWATNESVPAESQVGFNGNSNRWIYLDSTANDTTVLNFKFNANSPSNKRAIRFKVNMSKTAADPAGIHIAGAFQGWNSSATTMYCFDTASKVYEYIAITDTTATEYKFVNGTGGWESLTGAGTCVNGNGNRFVNSGSATQVLSIVCFNSCSNCPTRVIPQYKITFKIDVTTICNVDSVDIAGGHANLTNWGSGVKMTKGTGGQYSVQIMAFDSGTNLQYKFRYYKGGKVNWEQITSGSGNRELSLKSDTVLSMYCFNTFSVCNSLPAPQTITFKVDLKNVVPKGNCYLVLDYLGDNKTGSIRMTPVSGYPTLYSTTVSNICNGTVYYYFMNGDSSVDANKEQFADSLDRGCTKPNGVGGYNRELVRTNANTITLQYFFSSCKTSATGLKEANLLSNNLRLYPNPTSTSTVVEFNDMSNTHSVTVMDLTGRIVRSYSNYEYNALRIEKNELTAGIYFVNVVNDKNQTASVKLIIE